MEKRDFYYVSRKNVLTWIAAVLMLASTAAHIVRYCEKGAVYGAEMWFQLVLPGLAGVLYGLNFSSLTASRFDYNTSIQILVFVVLGGMGSVRGSIIAAALLTVLPEMLRGLNDYRMLIYAIVLIAMMIFNQSPQIAAWRKRLVEKVRAGLGKSKKTKEVA